MKKIFILFIVLNAFYIYGQTNDHIENSKKRIILTSFDKQNIIDDDNEFYNNVFVNLSKILINELGNHEYKNFVILDKDIKYYRNEEIDYQSYNLNYENVNSFTNKYNAEYIMINKISRTPLNEYFLSSKMINMINGKIYLNKYEKIDNYEEFLTNSNVVLEKITNLAASISTQLKK